MFETVNVGAGREGGELVGSVTRLQEEEVIRFLLLQNPDSVFELHFMDSLQALKL